MIVYRLTCIATGKVYIGITRYSLHRRISTHLNNSRTKRVYAANSLTTALRHYPIEKWNIEQVAAAETYPQLLNLERAFIAEHKSNMPEHGYNLTAGGQGTVGLKNPKTPEQKAKVSAFHTGRKRSEETKRRQSQAMLDWLAVNKRPRGSTTNRKRDAEITAAYFYASSYAEVAPKFGIKGAAAFHAVQRCRRRIADILENGCSLQPDELPKKIHPSWVDLAIY